MNSSLHAAALVIFSSLILASCDKASPSSPSAENEEDGSIPGVAAVVSEEVDRIQSLIAAELPSYLSAKSPESDQRIINEMTRRVVVRIPIVAEVDLYRDAKNGDFLLVEKIASKGDSKSAVIVLTGTKSSDRWSWQEQIEVSPSVDPGVLPLSRFPSGAVVKDSPEHLAAIADVTKRKEAAAAEEAVRKAETRKAILEPLTDLLKLGATTEGYIGKRKMKIEVTKANPSGTSWEIRMIPYNQSGKLETNPVYNNEINFEYDEHKSQCVVAGTGKLTGALLGSSVSASGKSLLFSGGNLGALTPKFTFE